MFPVKTQKQRWQPKTKHFSPHGLLKFMKRQSNFKYNFKQRFPFIGSVVSKNTSMNNCI